MGSPVSQPIVNIQLLAAQVVDTFRDRRNLITGQITPPGNAIDNVLVQDVHLLNEAQIKTLYGTGDLYWTIISWRNAVNITGGGIIPKLDVIAVDEAGGAVASSMAVQFTGTATADGTFRISTVDENRFDVTLSFENGATDAEIATAFEVAFNLIPDKPFVMSIGGTTILTFTSTDKGLIGDVHGVTFTGAIPGIVVALTGQVFASGNPDVSNIFDSIIGLRYTGVSWPEGWKDQLSVPIDEFDSRFNVSNGILDGVVFTGLTDTVANIKTFVTFLNSQSLVIMGNNIIDEATDIGPVILIPAHWAAAYFMGIRAKRLATGAQIADLVVSPQGLDATGGPGLASLAYHNSALKDAPVTLPQNQFTSTEQIELRNEGFSVFGVNTATNGIITSDVVTTRTTDIAGNPNDSFLYLNYVDTGSVSREIIFNTLKAAYAQSRLTEGDLIAGRSIENAASVKEQLMQVYEFLADLTLVQKGAQATAFFRDNTIVTVSLINRLVTIVGPLPIVTQIGTINYNLSLSFTTGQVVETAPIDEPTI